MLVFLPQCGILHISAGAEEKVDAILQALNSMESSLRASKSAPFVYTPGNASSTQDQEFKLELIKVSSSCIDARGISDADVAMSHIYRESLCTQIKKPLLMGTNPARLASACCWMCHCQQAMSQACISSNSNGTWRFKRCWASAISTMSRMVSCLQSE